MKRNIRHRGRVFRAFALTAGLLQAAVVQGAPLTLSDAPLEAVPAAPPMTMLVMGRDHRLYYEAYNDASDLDDDGIVDTTYKPDRIDYVGYFDSGLCYEYDGQRFNPVARADDKSCRAVANAWSGDFLNYLTMSRIDTIRHVLYGGKRVIDGADLTVLERERIPQNAHSWGKDYQGIARDGYDIRDYAPLDLPETGTRHLFANTNTGTYSAPRLRVINDSGFRVEEWLSIERPVAGNQCNDGSGRQSCEQPLGATREDFRVRVRVCQEGFLSPNCRIYTDDDGDQRWKPTGLLQEFGADDRMLFGLLTGSYAKNASGGVLRQNIASIDRAVDPDTGAFLDNGLISAIDRLAYTGFRYGGHYHDCAWTYVSKPKKSKYDTGCAMWGNPIGEMVYEATRYFAGATGPSSEFRIRPSGNHDSDLDLPLPDWESPLASGAPNREQAACARPFNLVIADRSPSYDSDQVPGGYYGSITSDLDGFDVSDELTRISDNEPGLPGTYFIGENRGNTTTGPSAYQVTDLGEVRGLAPEDPTREGSYNTAGVAAYAKRTDLVPDLPREQNVTTLAMALESPVPDIRVPIGDSVITLTLFAKTVNTGTTSFYPTNQIVDVYIDRIRNVAGFPSDPSVNDGRPYYRFQVNFEDVEQGADHDMDAITFYTLEVTEDATLDVTLESTRAAGGYIQHMGYVISGTTRDGTYLEVRDADTGWSRDANHDFVLDTPPGIWAGDSEGWDDDAALPLSTTRTFTPGESTTATFLPDPLWYAAKWGGFRDINDNDIPDLESEWDSDGDGDPNGYTAISNPTELEDSLRGAFTSILEQGGGRAAAFGGNRLVTGSRLYQSEYSITDWSGDVRAFSLLQSDQDTDGDGTTDRLAGSVNAELWSAAEELEELHWNTDRRIVTWRDAGPVDDGAAVPFRWPDINLPANPLADNGWLASLGSGELTAQQVLALSRPGAGAEPDARGEERLEYLRGRTGIADFRDRDALLGDIVHSSPVAVGPSRFGYPDDWGDGAPETTAAQSYSDFAIGTRDRDPMVYVGGNDGMLHAFDGETGEERWAYVPAAVYERLPELASPDYRHRYYVDGQPRHVDAFFDDTTPQGWRSLLVGGLRGGGQALYAIDVTEPPSDSDSETDIAANMLWEFSDADDADLGYTYAQPTVARLGDGEWHAMVGNGYNNTESDDHVGDGSAALLLIDIETGEHRMLDTDMGEDPADDPSGQNRPNGLSTAAPVDTDGDSIVDLVYAGDLYGNLWRFDLTGNPAQWDNAITRIFRAESEDGAAQPITVRPEVGHHPERRGGYMIYFGTGKRLEPGDQSATGQDTQTFYGIWDNLADTDPPITRDDLLAQGLEEEIVQTYDSGATVRLRVTSDNAINWENADGAPADRGWHLDLELDGDNRGEEVIAEAQLRGDRIVFSTVMGLEDICAPEVSGWLMVLDAESGARLEQTPFDTNRDGVFDDADRAKASDGKTVPASGVATSGGNGDVTILLDPERGRELAATSGGSTMTGGNGKNGRPGNDPKPGVIPLAPPESSWGRQSWREIR